MADLRDGFLRALLAHLQAGRGIALIAGGAPWQCCPGAIAGGLTGCTCWTPVYDRDQTTPDPNVVVALALGQAQLDTRPRMCGDCAYRPGSPEKQGHPDAGCDADELERIAREDRFYCHDGMRRPRAWRHPRGLQIAADSDGDYQPLIVDGVPYRADGRAGLLCAGWDARHRALTAKGVE